MGACTASTRRGNPCRKTAIVGTDRCNTHTPGRHAGGAPAGNANRTVHGYYARRIPADDLLGLDELPQDISEEIKVVRTVLRRLLEAITTEPGGLDRYAALVFQGARTVARLLHAGASAGSIDELIETAIDDIIANHTGSRSPGPGGH